MRVYGKTGCSHSQNSKKYFPSKQGPVKAVDGVDLRVESGEIFCFLGPNGAGKTTVLRVLTTLLVQDSGDAFVAGLNVRKEPNKVRSHIGYVSQTGGVDRLATGKENLVLQGQLYGMSTAAATARAGEAFLFLIPLTIFTLSWATRVFNKAIA